MQPLVLPRTNLEEQEREVHSKLLVSGYVFGYRGFGKAGIWQKSNTSVRNWTKGLKEKL